MSKQKIVYSHYEYNIDKILQNEKTRPLFQKHCKSELNLELLEFCDHVEKFKQAPSTDLAQFIMNTFVLENTEKEINVPKQVRMGVELDVQDYVDKSKTAASATLIAVSNEDQGDLSISGAAPPSSVEKESVVYANVFDVCYAQVRMSLYNSFSRFKRTKEFINFMQQQSDAFIRTVGTHKSEIQNIVLQLENFETPMILDSDVAFANECSNDYFYWRQIYYSRSDHTVLYSANNKHRFASDEVIKKTGDLFELKHEYTLPINAKTLMLAFFSPKHIPCTAGLRNINIIEYNADCKYPSTIFSGKLFCGKIATARDFTCVCSSFYDSSTNSYVVIVRNCEHPKAPDTSKNKKGVRGHYYWIYRFYDLGMSQCKMQFIVIGNSHGFLETSKGIFMDLMLKLGAPDLFQVLLKQFANIQAEQQEGDVQYVDHLNLLPALHKSMASA